MWQRGYVYMGSQLLAEQYQGAVYWIHSDPVTKSQRATDGSGAVVTVFASEVDPWGGETNRSLNQSLQPHRYTTYERDGNGSDEAMMRRYEGRWATFAQPDPYDGSYDLTDPQSLNRYAYVQNDPVNLTDTSGLDDDPDIGNVGTVTADEDPFDDPFFHGGSPGGSVILRPIVSPVETGVAAFL